MNGVAFGMGLRRPTKILLFWATLCIHKIGRNHWHYWMKQRDNEQNQGSKVQTLTRMVYLISWHPELNSNFLNCKQCPSLQSCTLLRNYCFYFALYNFFYPTKVYIFGGIWRYKAEITWVKICYVGMTVFLYACDEDKWCTTQFLSTTECKIKQCGLYKLVPP